MAGKPKGQKVYPLSFNSQAWERCTLRPPTPTRYLDKAKFQKRCAVTGCKKSPSFMMKAKRSGFLDDYRSRTMRYFCVEHAVELPEALRPLGYEKDTDKPADAVLVDPVTTEASP